MFVKAVYAFIICLGALCLVLDAPLLENETPGIAVILAGHALLLSMGIGNYLSASFELNSKDSGDKKDDDNKLTPA